MRSGFYLLAGLALLCLAASGHVVDPNFVPQLRTQNFNTEILKYQYSLVMFYAPW